MSFERRQFALEGSYAREVERSTLLKHAEKLGLVPPAGTGSSSLSLLPGNGPAGYAELPTTRISSRPAAEQVFQHVRGAHSHIYTPHLTRSHASQLGTKVSFGRARWDVDGASIFSVAKGKELAQEPVKQLSHYETQRMRRVRAAQWESPTVKGLRLLPVFTPGRALLWGTILAVWGSSACVLSGMRALGIEKGDDVGEKLREILGPYGTALAASFEPVRSRYAAASEAELQRPTSLAKLATGIRASLSPS